jgi:anti-sigma factor ChrR (cupin superfamily)
VLVLAKQQSHHLDEEKLEQYALGVLAAEALPPFEQHVLICHGCQDRLAEMEASVQGMQAEARQVRAKQMLSSVKTRPTSSH